MRHLDDLLTAIVSGTVAHDVDAAEDLASMCLSHDAVVALSNLPDSEPIAGFVLVFDEDTARDARESVAETARAILEEDSERIPGPLDTAGLTSAEWDDVDAAASLVLHPERGVMEADTFRAFVVAAIVLDALQTTPLLGNCACLSAEFPVGELRVAAGHAADTRTDWMFAASGDSPRERRGILTSTIYLEPKFFRHDGCPVAVIPQYGGFAS